MAAGLLNQHQSPEADRLMNALGEKGDDLNPTGLLGLLSRLPTKNEAEIK
jgi:hypothetical protein